MDNTTSIRHQTCWVELNDLKKGGLKRLLKGRLFLYFILFVCVCLLRGCSDLCPDYDHDKQYKDYYLIICFGLHFPKTNLYNQPC